MMQLQCQYDVHLPLSASTERGSRRCIGLRGPSECHAAVCVSQLLLQRMGSMPWPGMFNMQDVQAEYMRSRRAPCILHGAPSSSRFTPGLKSFDEMVEARMHR